MQILSAGAYVTVSQRIEIHSHGHTYAGIVLELSKSGRRARVQWCNKGGKTYERWLSVPGAAPAAEPFDVIDANGKKVRRYGSKGAATRELHTQRRLAEHYDANPEQAGYWIKHERELHGHARDWSIAPAADK